MILLLHLYNLRFCKKKVYRGGDTQLEYVDRGGDIQLEYVDRGSETQLE